MARYMRRFVSAQAQGGCTQAAGLGPAGDDGDSNEVDHVSGATETFETHVEPRQCGHARPPLLVVADEAA